MTRANRRRGLRLTVALMVALIGMPFLLSSLPASAAEGDPVFNQESYSADWGSGLTVSGTAEASSHVMVVLLVNEDIWQNENGYCRIQADETGSWSCSYPDTSLFPSDGQNFELYVSEYYEETGYWTFWPSTDLNGFSDSAVLDLQAPPSEPEDGSYSYGTYVSDVDPGWLSVRIQSQPGANVTSTLWSLADESTPYSECDDPLNDGDDLWRCDFGELETGAYRVDSRQSVDGIEVDTASHDFVIPGSGTFDAHVLEDGTMELYGTGSPAGNLYATVVASNGSVLCSDAPITDGWWTCHPDAEPGGYTARAYETTAAGFASPYSAAVEFTIEDDQDDDGGDDGTAVIDCAFAPGSLSLTTPGTQTVTVSLYSVGAATEESQYLPQYYGSCSGNSGTTLVGPFDDGGSAVDSCAVVPGEASCTLSIPAPGTWNLYFATDASPSYDYFFTIPEAPGSLLATRTGDSGALFSGSAVPGNGVRVVDSDEGALCSATADLDGHWECTAENVPTGAHFAYQTDRDSGGASDYAELPTLAPAAESGTTGSVTVAPSTPGTATVAPHAAPLRFTLTISGIDGPILPGQTVTIGSTGLPPGSLVEVELHSSPVFLGSTTVGPDGSFSLTTVIPEDIEPGIHHFAVTVTPPGEAESLEEAEVVIAAAAEDATEDDEKSDTDSDAAGGSRERADSGARNQPGAPSALTGSVPTVLDIIADPVSVAIAAGLALAIMLLVALPTELLNAALSSNTSRFGRLFTTIDRATARAADRLTSIARTPALAAGVLVLVTSIIFGFVDPAFGFDLTSLRLVLSLAIALFIVTYLASRISGTIVWRAWAVETAIAMQPTGLVFAVLGVIAARLLGFSPGFLVGLVIGVEVASHVGDLYRTRTTVVRLGVIAGLGVLAWAGYSIAVGAQGDTAATFGSALLQDTLVAITTEGLTGVMVALLPLTFLEGKEIFDRSKRLWVLLFITTGTVFGVLVLPSAAEGQEVRDLGTWVIVLIVFAALSVGLWAFLRFTARQSEPAEPAHERVHVE